MSIKSLKKLLDIIKMEESNLVYEFDYEATRERIIFISDLINERIDDLSGRDDKGGKSGATLKSKIRVKKSNKILKRGYHSDSLNLRIK